MTKATPLADRLHAQIMNLHCKPADESAYTPSERISYKHGARDTRHAAAELVSEALAAAPLAAPEGWQLVPKEPDDAILRPFYECPPAELPLAWRAALYIAAKRAPAAPGAAAVPPVHPASDAMLPPYIYGREAGQNEKVWTEATIRSILNLYTTHTASESTAVKELVDGLQMLAAYYEGEHHSEHPCNVKARALLTKYKATAADQKEPE